MSEPNDFRLVCRRRKRNERRNFNRSTKITQSREEQYCDKVDQALFLRKLDDTLVEIGNTPFTKFVLSQLTESLAVLNSNGISEIVCYGLGRFSQYRSPKCQLALLLYLKARYNARVYMYDPAFSLEEVEILRNLGLDIIETNEEGKRICDKTTLIYMPHCSRQLINNFLYANWGNGLSKCILFTNSFSKIVDGCLSRKISDTAGYILRIRPYVTEIRLENTYTYEEAFNDLNIHIFTKQDLIKVPSDFWNSREEPRYLNNEVEFITTIAL